MQKGDDEFMKKPVSIIVCLLMLAAGAAPAFGAESVPNARDYTRLFFARHAVPSEDAYGVENLKRLGLFKGTDRGDELDRGMTRTEALVTVIRLSGKESEALGLDLASDFSDIPEWASAYAGFARAQNLARGRGDGSFGANEPVTAAQYATMLLRILGYDDADGDFAYDEALDFARDAKLLDEWDSAYYKEKDASGLAFLRGDAAHFMLRLLTAPASPGSGEPPVITRLYRDGLIDREKAAGTMLARGEGEAEILRALENAYNEVWLEAAANAVDENDNIPGEVKDLFKESLYNWSKEAGTADGAAHFVHNIRNLRVGFASERQERLFRVNPSLAAYFAYPNRIVIRSDLNAETSESSVTHEFRHALSANLSLTVLEEGITELWNQEVDGGYYGYPYYFVNLAKLFFHTAGAKAVNESDLLGDYEELFYAVERESGVDADNRRLYSLLAGISPDIEEANADADEKTKAALSEINGIFFELVKGYYMNNFEDRVAESANYEEFADRLLAVGQLLYYPSAMISRADSDETAEGPSAYYGEDFRAFARDAMRLYSERTGVSEDIILQYFNENEDRRFCLEYLGRDAGTIFVKAGTGYRVMFKSGRNTYYCDFGTREVADRFAAAAEAGRVDVIEGAGFIPKRY
jgi:hypothetical protein